MKPNTITLIRLFSFIFATFIIRQGVFCKSTLNPQAYNIQTNVTETSNSTNITAELLQIINSSTVKISTEASDLEEVTKKEQNLSSSNQYLKINSTKISLPINVEPDISEHINIGNNLVDCPSLSDADSLSQTQLIERLTHSCRYDKLERPKLITTNGKKAPVLVFVRNYLYFMQNLEAHDLQFKIHILLQLRYVDARLAFRKVAPSKGPIMGEQSLSSKLWIPHLFLANEKSSSLLGTADKDVLTSISPDGTVIISRRISATLFCWMNLQKFPFDEQYCSTIFESWMYNASEILLHWEPGSPVNLAPELHLTEYVLMRLFTNETIIKADINDLRHGAFTGNYSSLSFTVHLAREMGFYLMDYFIPSMMIVAISWCTFWLQADQTAPRITLGTSTMLTFITLASSQGKTLPKVSYIKASEIWFLGCTGFIFASLVEFAFVNIIWRRRKNVELKKVNSKYIMKSTLTPRLARKEIGVLSKSRSCTSLNEKSNENQGYDNYLTVHGNSFTSINKSVPMIKIESDNRNEHSRNNLDQSESQLSLNSQLNKKPSNGWTTMTPQEISIWIDKRSRLVFPVAFLIFNIFYWSFVYLI
uniref:pH-sensitive chloride channel 2 n=1 Tax=Culicoides sonorensis TaxID=179676 RepID=A0A336LQY4_CULSO